MRKAHIGADPIHAAVIDDLKDQLLIVFLKALKRHGHSLIFPKREIDNTGEDLVAFAVDDKGNFSFELSKKL